MSEHLAEERLHDYAEGTLSDLERRGVERHLAACEACRIEAAAIRALLERVRRLPSEMEPEADLWPRIRSSAPLLSPTLSLVDATDVTVRPAPAARRLPRPALLAAAAVLLMALSSAVTALVLRQGARAPAVARTAASAPRVDSLSLASFAATEAEYRQVAAALEAAVSAQRDSLSPETMATVERNLRLTDSVIRYYSVKVDENVDPNAKPAAID